MKNILQKFCIVVFPLTFLLYYGSFRYLKNYQIRQEREEVQRGNVYIRNRISGRFVNHWNQGRISKQNYNPEKDDLLFIRNELSKIKDRKNNIPKKSKQEKRIISNTEPGMFSSHLCQRGFSKCHGIISCIFYIYIAGQASIERVV